MRKVFVTLSAIIVLLLPFARMGFGPIFSFFWREHQEGIMNPLGPLDIFATWWIGTSWSPFLVLLLTAGALSLWFFLPIVYVGLNLLLRSKKSEFFAAFNLVESGRSRHLFRLGLWEAFKKYNPKLNAHEFADLIDRVAWPIDFPPQANAFQYVQNIKWGDDGEIFWQFCKELFKPTIDGTEPTLLNKQGYAELMEARRAAAKFWDERAHHLNEGLIHLTDVQTAVKSNRTDIKALAITELWLAQLGWDKTEGKRQLFRLAKDHLDFRAEGRFMRFRAWLGI